jgi:hypothetical protein
MAFQYSPKIVTDGLVLYLDAANTKSYVSGSTTWNDISRGGNNGTLVNGPTFSSLNGGSIVFDGVDDYVTDIGTTSTFSFIQNTGVFTINAWVKPNVLGTAMYFIGNNDGTSDAKGFFIGKLSNNRFNFTLTYGVSGQNILNFQLVNYYTDTNWVNVTISSNGLNAIAYKNGTRFGTSNNITILSTGDSTRNLSVGRINNFNSSYWGGSIAQTSIYNRALTAQEVLQNYNATKSRFGLT